MLSAQHPKLIKIAGAVRRIPAKMQPVESHAISYLATEPFESGAIFFPRREGF
jgi:hypothetical protein